MSALVCGHYHQALALIFSHYWLIGTFFVSSEWEKVNNYLFLILPTEDVLERIMDHRFVSYW